MYRHLPLLILGRRLVSGRTALIVLLVGSALLHTLRRLGLSLRRGISLCRPLGRRTGLLHGLGIRFWIIATIHNQSPWVSRMTSITLVRLSIFMALSTFSCRAGLRNGFRAIRSCDWLLFFRLFMADMAR